LDEDRVQTTNSIDRHRQSVIERAAKAEVVRKFAGAKVPCGFDSHRPEFEVTRKQLIMDEEVPIVRNEVSGTANEERIVPISHRILLALLVPAWLVSYFFDRRISDALRDVAEYVIHDSTFWHLAKQGGEFWPAAVAIVLLALLHPWKWRASGVIFVSIVLGALVVHVLKWTIGRRRPVTEIDPFDFEFFAGGLLGFFQGGDLSFVSGHAQLAFTLAAGLSFFLPRTTLFWFFLAFLTASQRVAERAHYLSEALLGAIVGILSWHAAHLLCRFTNHSKPQNVR